MPRAKVTKAEISRAVEAVKACGLSVESVEIAPDGTIRVLGPMDKAPEPVQSDQPREWPRE